MRLLFVNKLYPPDIGGGAEVVLASLAAGCRRRGHEVLVATTTADLQATQEDVDGVHVVRLPLHNAYWHHGAPRQGALKRVLWHARDIHNLTMGDALSALIARHDPDLVCFHNLSGFSAAAWSSASKAGKPRVQVLHDYYHLCPRSQLFRASGSCARPCLSCRAFRIGRAELSNSLTAVIGVSQAVLDLHLQNGLFAEVKIRQIIHNARPLLVPRARDYRECAQVFGFIGALGEWKGIRQLLEAFERISSEASSPPLQLLVGGTGEASYVSQLRQRFASERITFVGKVDPERFYPCIDALIVPSIWAEPLPTVVAEALVCGVPVIGARRGGIPEMVSDGKNGLLYDPDRPGALEACLRRMAFTSGLARDCGVRARVGAAHFANMERMLDEHLAVYQAAVDACA